MFKLVLRSRNPEISLPFLARSCGINQYSSGLMEDMAGIDAVEICTVASGICEIEQKGRMIRLSAGESIFKLPGEHRSKKVLSSGGAVIYWTTFDGPRAADFMLSYAYPDGALSTGDCPVSLYNSISRGLIDGSDGAFRRMISLYTELIALLPGPEPEHSRQEQFLRQCTALIRMNYSDSAFNVDELADRMHLHRTTLLRLFREKMNCTPLEYLNQCRLDNAVQLLHSSLLPVAEIAQLSGFTRSNYFCRVFRRKTGMTPEQYRNCH